jgi:hypothetical protein
MHFSEQAFFYQFCFVHLKEAIQQQIGANSQMNLLYAGNDLQLVFNDNIKKIIGKLFRRELPDKDVDDLISYAAKLAMSSFYNINQFYQFNRQAEKELRDIYQLLLTDIIRMKQLDYAHLAQLHFKRLQYWLVKYQPDTSLLYPPDQPFIHNKVVCAEYEPATQMHVLNMNLSTLPGPILDIGCGKEHRLVDYLIQNGHTAFGIDREAVADANIQRISWLHYSFEKEKWGTIISHLGFSNHFLHNHLKQNNGYRLYAVKYMEILQSLKSGGSFYYAPDLPFIEVFLNPEQYAISKHAIDNTGFQSTVITKLN